MNESTVDGKFLCTHIFATYQQIFTNAIFNTCSGSASPLFRLSPFPALVTQETLPDFEYEADYRSFSFSILQSFLYLFSSIPTCLHNCAYTHIFVTVHLANIL